MTFKKGEKVKIISSIPSTYNGETATYDRTESKGYVVILNNGNPWFCSEIESLIDKREQSIYKRICNIKRPKPKVVKFKVGDSVECVGTSSGHDGDKSYGGGGWKIGFRFNVEEISNYAGCDICWYMDSHGVYAHHLNLISGGER